jgi:bifunctional non-homologous end joining protein LigD
MKRYPHGIYGEAFFQKQAPKHLPSWIPTRQFRTWPRRRVAARRLRARQLAGSSALHGAEQLHRHERVVLARRQAGPAGLRLFDLDPPDDGFELAIEVAHLIGAARRARAAGYVKTSGADGIHVVAPITRRSTFHQTYAFAEQVSRLLETRHRARSPPSG